MTRDQQAALDQMNAARIDTDSKRAAYLANPTLATEARLLAANAKLERATARAQRAAHNQE